MVTYNMDNHSQRMSRPRRGSSVSSGFRLLDADQLDNISSVSRNSIYKLKIDAMFDDTRIVFGLLTQIGCSAKIIPCHRIHNNRTCYIRNVSIEQEENHQVVQFQEIRQFVFEFSNISSFSTDLFTSLGEAHFLTVKECNVREVNFSSDSLVSLRIDNTGLQNLTIAPSENHNLNTLIINRNPISIVPSSIKYLLALSILDLSRNQLTYLDLDWFQQMDNLLVLDLSWNHFARIDGSSTVQLKRLRNLWVNHNHLSQIAWFPIAFPKLERVRMSENYWSCAWIRTVRGLIWKGKIHLYDSDGHCSETSEGGLCCYDAISTHSQANFEFIDIEFEPQAESLVGYKESSAIVADQGKNGPDSCYSLAEKVRSLEKQKLLLEREQAEMKQQFSKKIASLQENLVEARKDLEDSEREISRYRFKERMDLIARTKHLNITND